MSRPRALASTTFSLCLLTMCLAIGALSGPAAAQNRFGETTTVVAVEVPVQVIRDGRPVRGLTAENFEVFDGRKRQELTGFQTFDLSLVEPQSEELPVATLPATARRHFLLLFDLSFSQPPDVVKARDAARELVRTGLHPTDLVAVSTYSESQGARLLLGFTSDRRQVEYAIDTLGLADPLERVQDPLRLAVTALEEALRGDNRGTGESAGIASLGANTAILLENLRDLSALSTRAALDQQQNQINALTASLQNLAQLMRSVQGRKYVVFLSEGFDSSVLLGTAGSTLEEQRRIEEINRAAETGEYWKVVSDERYGSTAAQSVLMEMLEEFKRSDCVIQSVDISGLEAGHDKVAKGQDGLFIMANETGGELFRNYNNLTQAMGKVLETTSVTYVLAFQPEDLPLDGSYHRLKVKLKGVDGSVRLIHRPGYYAPLPYEKQAPIERQLATAGLILGGTEGGEFGSSVLAAAFRGAGEKAYVPVLIELDGASLLASHGVGGKRGEVLPTELYAYAIGSDGSIRDFFTQALGLDLAKAGPALEQSGFKFWGHFDLPPGDYAVRVLARNGATGATSVGSTRLTVPAFDGAQTALLPPLFPEPPGKWLMGREPAEAGAEVDYPFQIGGQPFIPAARPVVEPGSPAAFCLLGHNLPGGELTVSGRLYGADGEPVPGAEIEVGGERSREANGAEGLKGVFRVDRVAAGEYRFEVTVSGGAGGDPLTSSIPLVVGG